MFKDVFPSTRGGVEQHIADVVRSMPGVEFEILTAARSRRAQVDVVDGVRITRAAEYGRFASTPIVPSWVGHVRRIEADVVHLHLPNPAAETAFLAARVGTPLVVSLYAEPVRYPFLAQVRRPLEERILARSTRIVVSSSILAETVPALRHHLDRVVVVPFGVDPPQDQDPAPPFSGRPTVLFLGRLVWYKGVALLVEAMIGLDADLVVAGDGPERPRLERLAASLGLRRRVRFLGEVSDAQRSAWYRRADVFVLPSVCRAETFGIAMLEAMAAGTPVVSTEVGTGTSWVNQAGETGLVVPPRDAAALRTAVGRLLDDDELRRAMGEAAARRARERFGKAAMLDGLAAAYAAAVDPAPVGAAPDPGLP